MQSALSLLFSTLNNPIPPVTPPKSCFLVPSPALLPFFPHSCSEGPNLTEILEVQPQQCGAQHLLVMTVTQKWVALFFCVHPPILHRCVPPRLISGLAQVLVNRSHLSLLQASLQQGPAAAAPRSAACAKLTPVPSLPACSPKAASALKSNPINLSSPPGNLPFLWLRCPIQPVALALSLRPSKNIDAPPCPPAHTKLPCQPCKQEVAVPAPVIFLAGFLLNLCGLSVPATRLRAVSQVAWKCLRSCWKQQKSFSGFLCGLRAAL